jgi:hypothetical protein
MEEYLKRADKSPLVEDGELCIGGNTYKRVVLTPLMVDFGYKDIKDNPDTYYNELSKKPIVEQVTDVFNGIREYAKNSSDGLFEIYPFLGLNTRNYDLEKLETMLDKYFENYKGSREELFNNMGKFDGEIDSPTFRSNFFAGIKLYPPLGFDPWPDDGEELDKVKYLYDYCCGKAIPITAHGSTGGFAVIKSKNELRRCTSISRWEKVLDKYPELRLNLAHFPLQEKFLKIFPRNKRLRQILDLVSDYDNVYVDFSCRAVNDKYYVSLRRLIDKSSGELRAKLGERILFGTDFTINLMLIESYNEYLNLFSSTASLTAQEKHRFCCTNPERFLFRETA